jgi:N-acetylglucosaminyldiphosphoundecaprenol N-acetyl-beta-D-mannosaminyltransferase
MKDDQLPASITVMGVNITPFSDYAQVSRCIEELIASGKKAFSVAINPEKIYRANHEPELKTLLNRADIGICDGIGAALAVRLLKGTAISRITGISLFFELVKAASAKGWKVFLLGASPESNEGAFKKLSEDYPTLKIVGRVDGYFKDSQEVISQINSSGADIVFVAMGSPKQELWIAENRDAINASFCMGVGGTFDVVSGKVEWAPPFFRTTGTEWLYRLVREPKRWRRQLVLPKFAWAVLKRKFAGGEN